MDKPTVKAKEGPKQVSPGQLGQLTRNWAEFFGRLTASEDSHDKAQRLIQRFDMLDVVADGFFAEGRRSLITLWHGRVRVDYSQSLATLMRRNGVTVRDKYDSTGSDVTSFRGSEDRKGVWECGLDVVALEGSERRTREGEFCKLDEFGLKFADAHQAYEFASVCSTTALPKCRIAVGGTLTKGYGDSHLSLFNYGMRQEIMARWNVARTWRFPGVESTLQRGIFLLAVRDEKPVE